MNIINRYICYVFLVIALFATTLAGNLRAEKKSEPKDLSVVISRSLPDVDALKAKRASIEESKGIDDTIRQKALSIIDQSISLAQQTKQYEESITQSAGIVKTAPGRIKEIQNWLKASSDQSEISKEDLSLLSISRIEEKLNQLEAEQAQKKDELNQIVTKLGQGESNVEGYPEDIAGARHRLDQLKSEVNDRPVSGASPVLTDAKNVQNGVEQVKLDTEIRMLEQYMASHQTLTDFYSAEQDLALRKLAVLQNTIKAYQEGLQTLRRKEATDDRKIAERIGQNLPLSIRDQIDLNIALADRLDDLNHRESLLAEKITDIGLKRKEIDQEFDLAKERVDNLALTGAVGLALREQKQLLPSTNQFRQNSYQRQQWMAQIQEYQIDLDRKQRDIEDVNAAVLKIISSIDTLSEEEKNDLIPQVRNLILSRQSLIEKLQAGYKRAFKGLRNLEYSEQQLISRSEEFEAFLDKHLLWIRSSEPIGFSDVGRLIMEISWITSFSNVKNLISDFQDSLKSRPVIWLMGILLMVLLLWGRKIAGPYWQEIANKIRYAATDSIPLTFKGFFLLIYESMTWAFPLGFVSFQLSGLERSAEFTQSLAMGFSSAAELTFLITFFYGFCRNNGLAQAHFQWHDAVRKTIRANLRWFGPLLVVLDFIIETMGSSNAFQYGNSMAKLGLLAQGIGMSLFCVLMFRFSGGVVTNMIQYRPDAFMTRIRLIWYPLAIAVPFSNVLLVFYGYYYSAMELRNLISKTIVLFIGLFIFRDLALRGLRLAHRKYLKQEALKEAFTSPKVDGGKTTDNGTEATSPIPEINFAEINDQTRALLGTAIFILALMGGVAIWKEPARAFSVLQEVQLWTYNDMVNGVAATVPITLANLIIAMIYVAVIYMAARNLPGLLEITIINRLSMDSGARYAFITLCRYAIIAFGVLLTANAVGFNWSKLQWLLAALGVGLGFGLQEIVANFISGLIVLFERPFRIGDTITIDDTTGTVSQIKIRATTVVDWDRRELIVPNKEFVTGKLINWSLSDPIVRIVVPVGIAYGSDTKLAEALLLKSAKENSLVLDKPAPLAVFKGFGDNSLNFELRVYINGIDDWIPMLHKLNLTVDEKFREAGVTISFPQRDVHLDTSKPLDLRVISQNCEFKPSSASNESNKEGQ